jgi:hypothetical protein
MTAHAHAHVEAIPAPSETGSVVADIGGDVGAAIVYVDADLAGHEIEIRPSGAAWDGTHTGIRERHVNGGVIWAAFFGSLRAGRYEVRVRGDESRTRTIDVAGGHVTEARW